MSLHRNRVQMTVTGAPGTGAITLNAATTGYQSFSSAYGADATVDILITEGTSWEVARNCTYTNSGTTVTRGTLEAGSSAPSRVSFTSGAIVSVIATAANGNNWGLNEIKAAVTGSNVTGVVGTMHILDLSGLTADRDFVLPATCAVGDRIGVMVEEGDADHELLLKPDGSDTINGGSAGAEWSRLFITGECVIFRCVTANSAWIVEYDGRIPQAGFLRVTTAGTANTGATLTRASEITNYVAAADVARGCTVATGSGAAGWQITVRRRGIYNVSSFWLTNANVNANSEALVSTTAVNGAPTGASYGIGQFRMVTGATAALAGMTTASTGVDIDAGNYVTSQLRTTGTNNTGVAIGSFLSLTEVL